MSLDETAFDAARNVVLDYVPTGVAGGISIQALVRRCIEAYLDSLGEIEPVEAPKPEFAAGDIVRCIDAGTGYYLTEGACYTLGSGEYGESRPFVVDVVLDDHGKMNTFRVNRFELVSQVAQVIGVEATVAYDTVNLSDETITKLASAFWTSPDRRRTPRTP